MQIEVALKYIQQQVGSLKNKIKEADMDISNLMNKNK